MHHMGFDGSVEVDMARHVCRGKLLFIDDLVTYEAATPAELRTAFEEAVVDYIETCQELGREPSKPFKGVFQVRITPELHKEANLAALRDGCSLNEFVHKAIRHRVHGANHVTVNLQMPEDAFKKPVVATTSGEQQWTQVFSRSEDRNEYARH